MLQSDLNKLCEFPESQGWDLKYRASRDGFSGENFHTNCDGISNTLTIIKTTNGNIFGAFAVEAWTNRTRVIDPEAFIVSLINKENNPFKAVISSTHPRARFGGYRYYALYNNYGKWTVNNSASGPSFGYDNSSLAVDISITSDSNTDQSSSSNFGYSFKHQDYPAGSDKAQEILAGSYYFQTIDIEVFTKKD